VTACACEHSVFTGGGPCTNAATDLGGGVWCDVHRPSSGTAARLASDTEERRWKAQDVRKYSKF
jgi:hypothetical protein